ncbi:hypothetical protein OCK74_09225 [Chitinophagaceae bacterium LB-8]|uniref:Magnetosome protein MamS/MamX domain-containing protein n=1 Tax=Paraflavisolibacter caeni TaxID=2982496 RepID=A0A9X2XUJ2_9BACT|nr:hypothetical protein [Paraflavisolibacter caeni]MCU7549296.1 hypothetical protein [Paraflavisolibacter caeni]
MKSILKVFIFLLIVSPIISLAQNRQGGWGRNSNYNRIYDTKTVTEVKGQVVGVEQVVPLQGMSSGIHLLVNTGSDTISVHLGPKWYLDNQSIQFTVNDKVEVKGSKVPLNGEQIIIAREISKEGKVFTFRDESGIPLWAGKGKGKSTR